MTHGASAVSDSIYTLALNDKFTLGREYAIFLYSFFM